MTYLTILITLASTCTRIPSIIFFTWEMSYWLLNSHWHLSLFHFCLEIHFLPSNWHLHSHFCEYRWFINVFYHVKYFQGHIFYFIMNTYSTEQIFYKATTPITPIHTNVSSNSSVGPSPRTKISFLYYQHALINYSPDKK